MEHLVEGGAPSTLSPPNKVTVVVTQAAGPCEGTVHGLWDALTHEHKAAQPLLQGNHQHLQKL